LHNGITSFEVENPAGAFENDFITMTEFKGVETALVVTRALPAERLEKLNPFPTRRPLVSVDHCRHSQRAKNVLRSALLDLDH
jgi:hypothetical protein